MRGHRFLDYRTEINFKDFRNAKQRVQCWIPRVCLKATDERLAQTSP